MTPSLPRTTRVLSEAVDARVFPGAIVEVGRHDRPLATIAVGTYTYEPGAPMVAADTIYDLASLTKVLSTTALVLDLTASGRFHLDDPISRWVAEWSGPDRQGATLRDLLEHCAGLPAHREYYRTLHGKAAFLTAICAEPLETPPRTRSTYSDIGFILLGLALEVAGGTPLNDLFASWRDRHLGPQLPLTYLPPTSWLARIPPTEIGADGRAAHGIVHDENAAALGGVAGHAGLFGSVGAVGVAARWWLRRLLARDTAEGETTLVRRFAEPSLVPGSSRALGWDTMRPTSSCGTRLSSRAIGHTGFTGTSLWLDPAVDLYVAMLSNRVHPSRSGDGMSRVRPALHDTVVDELSQQIDLSRV